jgi:Ca2+-binding EF-hand superfamily protein
MKFATIALIASVSAIKISQKTTQLASRGGLNTAKEVMDGCDADGSGEVSKKEVTDCIMLHYEVPKSYRQHVVKAVNDIWPHIDTDGSGEVSLKELEAVLGKGSMLAQKELDTAANIMDACDADSSGKISQQEAVDCIMKHYDVPESYRQHVVDAIKQMWPHLDHNGDGEVDLSELKAALGEEEEKRDKDHGRMESA